MREFDLGLTYQPLQKLFFSCPAHDVLFGGSAGGSKSFCAAQKAMHLAAKYPGIHIGLFRRSLPELRMTLLREAQDKYPQSLYKYRDQTRQMTWVNGSVVSFNYVETDKDLLNYKSVEFDVIIIDEAVDLTEHQIVYLKSRLRTTRKDFQTRFYMMTNPLGVSHAYLNSRYIIDKDPYKLYPTPETDMLPPEKQRYQIYIPARLTDNKVLMDNDPMYIYNLRELPEDEFLALLLGIWDIQSGLFFTEWDNKKFVEKEDYIPKPTDELYIYFDWGLSKPCAVGWIAVDVQGTEHLYRELYTQKPGQPDTGLNLRADEIAEMIKNMTPPSEKIRYMVSDSQCWAKDGTSALSIFEIMQHILRPVGITIIQAKKDRISGWQATRKHLRTNPNTGVPLLQVSPSCKHFIRSFPILIKDEKKDGDLDTRMEDHHADGFRYFCMSRPIPKTIEDKIKAPVNSLAYYENIAHQIYGNYTDKKVF